MCCISQHLRLLTLVSRVESQIISLMNVSKFLFALQVLVPVYDLLFYVSETFVLGHLNHKHVEWRKETSRHWNDRYYHVTVCGSLQYLFLSLFRASVLGECISFFQNNFGERQIPVRECTRV